MIEKLNENASLGQLITAFENSTNEIKTTKNNLTNILGNPFSEGTRFSEFETNLQTLIATFKNNLKNKNVSISDIETLESLIDKISNINAYTTARGVQIRVPTDYLPYRITTNVDFTPVVAYVYCNVPIYKAGSFRYANSLHHTPGYNENGALGNGYFFNISNLDKSGFLINVGYDKLDTRPNYNDISWVVIGYK
ncbi:hypothetical protein NFZ15_017990 [Clostridioides difficile]|uniref:hypothetical protein n=1 Tax=Clostridioides difficile TaxID=1496 RepID=UPI00093A1B37|nr:hypothetical protein [Clostridioides difficile]ELX4591924.1 hypothetical protein [Clostridioides difficile]MBG0257700.1 hypothetical protein [Clostridioides difficile]MBH7537527.1 hypothetical protein [Clostridioides difficile]MBH7846734.1 hypothetical protein [Clostridioides difficile]MBY1606737.1 hypothetical protein [Clostridioides difficile]